MSGSCFVSTFAGNARHLSHLLQATQTLSSTPIPPDRVALLASASASPSAFGPAGTVSVILSCRTPHLRSSTAQHILAIPDSTPTELNAMTATV